MLHTKLLGYLLLFLALGVASVAAYFSIVGLTTLFAAAVIPVIIMAVALEAGKLGSVFFLHRYWYKLPFWKWFLSTMVVILMLVTSMGIFGFLAKGHIEQETPVIEIQSDLDNITQSIEFHQSNIVLLNRSLTQINAALGVYITRERITTGYTKAKKQYQPEIDSLQESIRSDRVSIRTLRTQALTLQRGINQIEAELGPIKYVAELFGFDITQSDGKGKAVRFIIVLLMIAFDPLAIALIMSTDWLFIRYRDEVNARIKIKGGDKSEDESAFEERKKQLMAENKRVHEQAEKISSERNKQLIAANQKMQEENESLVLEQKKRIINRARIENKKLRESVDLKTETKDIPHIEVEETEDPLSFIGEVFESDQDLISYLIENKDVFKELIKLYNKTNDSKIKDIIDAVSIEVEKRKLKGWLD